MSHFQEALDRLRELASDPFDQGRRFERLIKTALQKHPGIYGDRFEEVCLWGEWPDRDGPDRGIDLVARERDGGHCAIQCKFFAPDRPVPKAQIDKFIAASDRALFTSRLIVNTGGVIRSNTLKTLQNLGTPCRVLELADLAAWPVDDWRDFIEEPERLDFNRVRFEPYPYQREAVDAVAAGFRHHDRGQLILPCGTGKTAVTLWVAETLVDRGGRVLYLVPSISLMAQTMREWAWQKSVGHRYIGICSDTRAGRNDEDASLLELDLPVTTDPQRIAAGLQQTTNEALTVVFCTYQSLELVAQAQQEGAPDFDLVVADEAHRTTGADNPVKPGTDARSSPFQLVHDAQRIQAHKRLYATATPRLYTEAAKKRASQQDMAIYSMDDAAVYGPEFHRMTFSEAVEGGWLTDYRVAILTLSATDLEEPMANFLAQERASGLNLEDAALFLGCWDALADPEGRLAGQYRTGDMHQPVRRAIAFSNTIRQSKLVASHWNPVIDTVRDRVDEGERTRLLDCEVHHVDGTFNSLERTRLLSWLSEGTDDGCRILSNARCLTEGVDVPALDAVLFMHPRKSQIDVVQAVGRVMRRAPGKEFGYIILPVVVPEGADPEQALNNNQTFKVVWDVLRALRSHDERLDAEINSLDLNRGGSERIFVVKPPISEVDTAVQIPLDLLYDIPPGAIYSRIVEKCGDRQYWPRWAEDVADIADRIRARVTGLIDDPERITLQRGFRNFLADMRRTLNPSVTETDVVAMVAQHLVTGPVFQALFASYEFAAHNPVSRALDRLVGLLETEGLENETRDLEPFYASVRRRARSLDNAEARQTVLLELYERFFSVALRKDAERLGIVYTPVELVDFLLQSADDALRRHLGRSLSDTGVHILDPFTGTGTFIVRLLQNRELIRDKDLLRKFRSELHANEIVLLAYYIAAINIEETYHGRLGAGAKYQPFGGIALADTFTLSEGESQFAETMPDNSERVTTQQASPVQVIVGNPPYSAWQRSATDRATEKSRSGQDRGQQGGVAPDFVPQQANGQIRSEILLKCAHDVQGGPSEDAHHGGGVAPAQAAVVLPELHVQGAVQAVLHAPVAAHQGQQRLGIHGPAGDVVADGALAPVGPVAFRADPDQAAQAGPFCGVGHPLAEAGSAQDRAGAPLAAPAVALDGLALVLHFGREGAPVGLLEGRAHLGMQGGLVALDGQYVVGTGGLQVLHDGPLAAGGVDRDDGPLQHHAFEQAGDGRDFVALGLAGLLGQGQPLPHQEGAHQEQGPGARGPVARPARELAVQGQDQFLQAGQAGAVQQQEGGLHGRFGLQPAHEQAVGVVGRHALAQGQPLPEPGLVVGRELGHGGQRVGAPGQGHQQRAQEHGQRIAHAARVARVGEVGQFVGEGAQGLEEGGIDGGERVKWDRMHEGRNAFCGDSDTSS